VENRGIFLAFFFATLCYIWMIMMNNLKAIGSEEKYAIAKPTS
jgi:hypothetical protein